MASTHTRAACRRGPPFRRISGAALIVASLTLGLTPGCASYRGARLYISGSEALDRGDAARAIHDLEAAAALVPEGSEIYNHLGLAYADVGRNAEALRAFDRAVELDCTNDAARANLTAARGAGDAGSSAGEKGDAGGRSAGRRASGTQK